MNSMGFIQTIFMILRAFSDSEELFEKHKEMIQGEFIKNLFSLASNKNMIALPFIQMILASLISKSGFPKSLFDGNINNSLSIFTGNSNKLVQMIKYPNYKNELPLLFSIYSNLCQTRLLEISIDDQNQQKINDLFDKYFEMNKELFKIGSDAVSRKERKYIEGEIFENESYCNEEEEKKKKKRNFRSLYLVFYYSILLANEMNIPYPKFLFAHDWIMQHFGGFRTTISKEDIDDYVNKNKVQNENEQTIEFKSEIYENNFELNCSCKLVNIKESSDDDDFDYDDDFDDDDDEEDEEDKNENDNEEENEKENEEEDKNENENEEEKTQKEVKNDETEGKEENKNNEDEDNDKDDESNKDEEKKSKDKKKKKSKEDKYKIFIHQIKDNSQIEIPSTDEAISVTFPFEIQVIHEKGKKIKKNELKSGDAFVIDFVPSENQQREIFLQHYSEIEKDFTEFISLSKYDNQLSEQTFSNDENEEEQQSTKPQQNENENNNNSNENNDNENNDNDNHNDNDNSDTDDDDEKEIKFTRNDYKVYEINKIPENISPSFLDFTDRVVSLRHSTQSTYRRLVEEIMGSYGLNDNDSDNDDDDFESCYMSQIIKPAYSMKTDAKFKFIFKIMSNNTDEDSKPTIIFNRFEQQKFMDKLKKNEQDQTTTSTSTSSVETDLASSKYRPLFVQFMEQVEEDSIHILRNRHDNPFSADLIGENAADAGGPGREVFTQLIEELMNPHIGVFTANPNNRHKIKDVNKEDLIPNPIGHEVDSSEMNEEVSRLLPRRFIYAGALIACAIVSTLPQPMKLSMIVWEYLTKENVSIESVYEVDHNFKEVIQSAENLLRQISSDFDSISEDQFEKVFPHNFQIEDSFDKMIELIPSGSKTKVTKENLHEFIELAKKVRCDEFKNELSGLKEGFDKIMTNKNIVKILRPHELKLLVCGEPNCSVKLMKTMINISAPYDTNVDEEKLTQIFWNVMESFSVEERMKFIRFSSGNLSLPAPGMKWESDIDINILDPGEEGQSGKNLAYAHTCSSNVDIPFYESEEQLAVMLRKSINFSGLITDSIENTEEVSEFF